MIKTIHPGDNIPSPRDVIAPKVALIKVYFCSGTGADEDTVTPGSTGRKKRRGGRSNVLFELLLLGADGSGKSTFIRQMQVNGI